MLLRHDVDFVVIGGIAGILHGSAYPTYDLDIAYDRSEENLEHLAGALRELDTTPHVPIDLSDAAGAPSYDVLKRAATTIELDAAPVRIASLDHLICMKKAAGRTKDKLMQTEYELLADRLRERQSS